MRIRGKVLPVLALPAIAMFLPSHTEGQSNPSAAENSTAAAPGIASGAQMQFVVDSRR